MNVPIKPATEPGTSLFLLPGVNPFVGQGGFMSPVLTYGENFGQGNQVWGIANWFFDCPGNCHDQYLPVIEGDTIHFWQQYIETFANGSQWWIMGYHSLNQPNTTSTFNVYRVSQNVQSIWATSLQFYLNISDPANFQKLPRSYFYTWNLKITLSNGNLVTQNWFPSGGNSYLLNCSYDTINNGVLLKGTRIVYPPYSDGCSVPYSRTWNYGCSGYCGCNNEADGTPKISCDYCCAIINGYCYRESGPTYSLPLPLSDAKHFDSNLTLPHPGGFQKN